MRQSHMLSLEASDRPPLVAHPPKSLSWLISCRLTEADAGTAAVFVDEKSGNFIGWPFTFSPPLAEEPRRSIYHLLV